MSELAYETPLAKWLRETNTSAYAAAHAIGLTYKHVVNLRDGLSLPGLVTAFKVDRYTKGAVPPAAWLDTPKARAEWARASNWEKWQEQRKDEQRRNGPRRKADPADRTANSLNGGELHAAVEARAQENGPYFTNPDEP
jgi:hypothetical protein